MTAGTVLLVEDNPLTRKFVRRALECHGCAVVEADSAAGALGVAGQQEVDLVLLDLILPDMNGFELVPRLRALPACADTPILACTGALSREDEARLSRAGFDGVISKPIQPDHLGHLVRGHLPSRRRERKRFGEGRLLVVVDDDPLQLKIARLRMKRLGFEVETASDGVEALEVIRRTRPHAVVTDALMPRLDGFGLCLALRQDPELNDLPIVMCTATYVEAADRQLAESSGANWFVTRSADFAEISGALEQLFTTARAPTTCPPPAGGGVESARTSRALRQLERQAAINAELVQRCSTLAAELSVLSTVADALVDAGDVQGALFQVLINCLDVIGASRGAIYVTGAEGGLTACATHGLGDQERLSDMLLMDGGFLERLELAREPVELRALLSDGAAPVSDLEALLVTPLIARGELAGALLIEAPASATTEDYRVFIHAVGGQISLALSLARAFAQVGTSEQRARALMENAGDAIFVSNESGTLLEVNHAGERLLGLQASQIVSRDFGDFVPAPPQPANDPRDHAGRTEDSVKGLERSALRSDGTLVPIELSSTLVEAGNERLKIAIVRDVSERNALAEQLRQAQKMEAIGRLAGGVAHDFNNMLSVVISFSELALRDLPADSPVRLDIAEIKKAGENAADLTRQLLAFSRQEVMEPRIVHLTEIVSGMENMLRRLIGADIVLTTTFAEDLATIRADVGQLHQVILNLIVNARDAMPRGGKLWIDVSNVDVTASIARRHAGAKPGPYVVLRVEDSGVGMDAATRARIFEPFFTTKDAGEGTGLGLATVFGIVQQSDGFIRVDSRRGRGTTFEVLFPRADGESDKLRPNARPKTLEGSETVLLVEDDVQVRTAARSILQRHGYKVIEAVGADDALGKCADGSIDLLLTDIVLPEVSGPELIRRAKRLSPKLRVLCMSGYSADRVRPHGALDAEVALLAKPITPVSLTRKVREVLDRGSSVRPNTG